MKRIFLVDTENIGTRFLTGKETLTAEDKIILFNNESSLVKTLQELTITKSAVEVKHMSNHRKNAMDFQICTYLGMLVSQYGTKCEYYIVSADRGYESSLEFVRSNCGKGTVIEEVINLKCEKTGELARLTIDDLLPGFSKKAKKEAAAGLRKTHNLCSYHNYLQNTLPIDGKKIYQILKGQYDELRLAL